MKPKNPYVKKLMLHLDGEVGHTIIKCREHPRYSPRERKPICAWCRALFFIVKASL